MLTKDERSRARSERNTAARIRHSADAAIAGTLRAGFEGYDRARDLPRLTRLAPRDFQTGYDRPLQARYDRRRNARYDLSGTVPDQGIGPMISTGTLRSGKPMSPNRSACGR